MNGRWVPHLDAWLIPYEHHDEAQELCRVMGLTLTTLSVPWSLPFHRVPTSSPTVR